MVSLSLTDAMDPGHCCARTGIRVNSVFSSYRMVDNAFSQRIGDLAGPVLPTLTGLTMTVLVGNSIIPETICVPYVALFGGNAFSDKTS